jgi:hypothetical protein
MSNFTDKDIDRLITQAKQRKIAEEKRKFYQAKKEREASSTPMAEGPDLKSAQCQFESDLEDYKIDICPNT